MRSALTLIRPTSRAAVACGVAAWLLTASAAAAPRQAAEAQAPAPAAAEPAAQPAPAAAEGSHEAGAPATEAAPHAAAEHAASEHETEAEAKPEGLLPTIARVLNFAVLVGILIYFLKTPVSEYLSTRGTTIRKELTDAKALRTQAEVQLAAVREKLAALPAELKALERRGQEELARERERLTLATAQEREKLVDRTRREIDLQSRVAHRELVEHVADLAVSLARTRLERSMTADDQNRLVERYTAEVRQ